MAINNEDKRAVAILLKTKNIRLDIADNRGFVPLHLAVGMRLDKIVEMLLAAGANPNQELPPAVKMYSFAEKEKASREGQNEEEEKERNGDREKGKKHKQGKKEKE